MRNQRMTRKRALLAETPERGSLTETEIVTDGRGPINPIDGWKAMGAENEKLIALEDRDRRWRAVQSQLNQRHENQLKAERLRNMQANAKRQEGNTDWGEFDPSWQGIKNFGSNVATVGGGLLSGLRKGAHNLFNDPTRMALLQGGLTAMNPNSYYDQQGFYSTAGGLNRALRTAGNTYRDVQDSPAFKRATELMKIREWNKSGRGQGEFQRLLNERNRLRQLDPKHPDIPTIENRMTYLSTLQQPNDVRSYEYMRGLSPREQQDWFANKRGPKTINQGGYTGVLDPLDQNRMSSQFLKTPPPAQMPSFKKEQAIATAEGKTLGETSSQAMLDLPSAKRARDNMLREIDEILNHPDLANALGMVDQYVNIEGYNADIQARIAQLRGKNFMNAYQGLKGGGVITEIEGAKAESAQARLSQAQSPEAFKQALRDLKLIVLETYKDTEEKTGVSKKLYLRRSTDKAPESDGGFLDAKRKRVQELKRKKMENR